MMTDVFPGANTHGEEAEVGTLCKGVEQKVQGAETLMGEMLQKYEAMAERVVELEAKVA